ncbi:MAG: hypothetical protein B6D64_02840 [Bacteroidetes bacterium 4484_276]|nr:MAG: hypothetical protein B6D64_02840 [Bacteroidetes bacterium 4484_276]OYT13026.1 MAG: hypothetical protein B6I19_07260 [Bacteroidetes bacterium 4572_114]
MRKIKSFLMAIVFLGVTLSQSGCIGSFQLTTNLYDWNQNDVGGKWGPELVFAAFVIIPVYAVTLLADGIVLNSIEFWTGNDPLAMQDGEKETKIVQQGDDTYKLTAEKNRVQVEKIAGENQGEEGEFIYNDEDATWTYNSEQQQFHLVK